MSEVKMEIHPRTSKAVYRDDSSARFPVKKHTITVVHRYVVGTDFTSGDSLAIYLYGAQKVLFAVAKTPSGTLLTITESGTAPTLVLTTGTSTTDIEVMVVFEV